MALTQGSAATASDINALKARVKAEMKRRRRNGSLTAYAGTAYDYTTTPAVGGCGECAAWSYQSAGGVLGIRNTNICHMHKARYLANIYYWNKYYRQNNIPKRMKFVLSKEDILNYIDEDEYNLLLELQGD